MIDYPEKSKLNLTPLAKRHVVYSCATNSLEIKAREPTMTPIAAVNMTHP